METNELVKALQQYSQDLIAFKLDAEFAYAVDQSASAMESMQEELDRVKAERDAAVKDILARDHCDVCKHNHGESDQCEANEYDCNGCKAPCMCASCRDESNWQWRGLEGRKEL